MVRPKSTPQPGSRQKPILGKRQKPPDATATSDTTALKGQNPTDQDGIRSSKRARKTSLPYQVPESIGSILRAVSKLEEAEKNQSHSSSLKTKTKSTKVNPTPSISKSAAKRTKTTASIPKPMQKASLGKTPKQKIAKGIAKLTPQQPKKNPVTKKLSTSVPGKPRKKLNGKSKKLGLQTKNVPTIPISSDLLLANTNTTTKGKSKKIKEKVKPGISDSTQGTLVKPSNKRKSGKGALNPRPNITKYDKDPTFFSNFPIPHVSTLAHSRLLIRAVLLNDMKLLKELLTKDSTQISSACVSRSPFEDMDALTYAIKLGNKEAIKILVDLNEKASEKFGQSPDLMLENESTGHGSRMMLGHALRNVTVARGGKEGNTAFLMDSRNYHSTKIPNFSSNPMSRIQSAIKEGAAVDSLEYYVQITTEKKLADVHCFTSNIIHAIRAGRNELAGKWVNMAINRGGHGFNQLHEEALLLAKNKPFSPFKAVSVVKKCTDNDRITPLHCAAINPNPNYLQTLLNSKPEYNLLDSKNWTPIHYAAVCSGDGPLKLLLGKSIPTLVIDKEGNTPLHLAVSRGRLHNVKLILANEQAQTENNNPNPASLIKVNRQGMTPFHLAAAGGHEDILKVLLDAGADGNKSTSATFDGVTPLMIACRGGHLDVVKLLIEHGVKTEIGDRRGRTAIAYAVINGHADIVSFLLRVGVNHEAKDSSGNGLIHYAAAYGWYFSMQLLLEAGCDPNQGNLWKMTPMALAFMKGHMGIVEMLVKQPGVDIDSPIDDSNGMSLLLKTCQSSKLNISLIQKLKFLIDLHKADCKKLDFQGNNGLHYVVAEHRLSEGDDKFKEMLKYLLEVAKLLIDRGCDPGALNGKNESPLFLAIHTGNFWLAEKLIEWGQKINVDVNENGNSILHEIVKHAISAPAKLLYEKLAKDTDSLAALKGMVNLYNKEGFTPLLQVLNSFKTITSEQSVPMNHLITFLVKKLDADVNAAITGKDGKCDSVLHLAVSTNYVDKVISILLAKKPNLDPLNKDLKTPLAMAILNGLVNPARILINAGANVNFKLKNEKSTGLLLVLGKKQPKLFSLIPSMVLKGADVLEVTKDTKDSILHYVSKNPAQTHALEAIQSIINAGADVNLTNFAGRTPMTLCVNARGKETDATYDVEDALISAGANITLKDMRGKTPLHYGFVKIGNPLEKSFFDPIELVMMIVNAIKDVKAIEAIRSKDQFGGTALHYAATRGSTICCSYLVTEMSGNIDVQDNRGNTPFGLAVLNGHEGCSLYFQQQGADFSKILDTNIQIQTDLEGQDRTGSNTSWLWSHEKLQNAEIEKRKSQDMKYPIFQEVVNKDWQGILHLMLGSLKSSGTGVSVGVAAAIKTQRLKLATKLIHCVKQSKELEQKQENLLHTLAKYSKPGDQDQSNLQIQVTNSLLKKGVSPTQLDDSRANASIYAAVNLNYPLIMELSYALDNSNYLNIASKLPPDSYGRTSFTALFWSLDQGTEFSKEIKSWASSLLSHGATANITSQYPVILSPYPGVRCFVKHNKEIRSHPKYSPLTIAVIRGNYIIVKWLLSLGSKIDTNFGDEEGRTPLMHAVRLNDVKMVKLLLNPNTYDHEKDTSPWRAKYTSWVRGKGGLELELNRKDKKGWTAADHLVCPALQQASYVYANVEPVLTILYKAGALFTTKSGDNTSPLERAILHKRQNIVDLIYKLMKTPANQQIIIKMEYESLSKIENEPGLSPKILTFADDATKSTDIKEKEAEDQGLHTIKPDPLLELEEDNSAVVIDQEQNIPYDCIMTKVDISYGIYGMYNFYKMQVVKQPKGKELVFLFTQWGRVGDQGQYQKTPFQNEDEATKEFKKIFKAKSGNGWEQLTTFTPLPKRYRLVNKELTNVKKAYEVQVNFDELLNSAKIHRSVLKPEVYGAIKQMSLAHKMSKNEDDFRYYRSTPSFQKSEKMPIISTAALKRGEEILKEIGKAISEQSEIHQKSYLPTTAARDHSENVRKETEAVEKIVTLSEEYYALIPVYGFAKEKLQPVFDWNSLRQRREEIHNLIHLGLAKELLLAAELNSKLTNPFEYIYRCLGTKVKLLDSSNNMENDEAQMILQYIHNTKEEEIEIQGIYKLQRQDEEELTLDNRWFLWHGTKSENLLSILQNGLQVAPLGANLSGHLFGKGIYFADMFTKSLHYCTKTGGCDSKFMLLCEVALGKVHEVSLNDALEQAEGSGQFLPPGRNSLKTSDSQYEPDPGVSVVWKGRTVPLGQQVEIEYKEDESSGLNYNEFIVFNHNQVKLRYLVQFEDDVDYFKGQRNRNNRKGFSGD